MRKEAVVRIEARGVGRRRGGELIGAREHDGADQLLNRPAVGHKLLREVIEQLGMRGALAGRAEIIDRAHEARTHQPAPRAIRDHARGERMGGARDPVGQLTPAAFAGRELRWRTVRRDLQQATWRLRAEAARDAADTDLSVADFAGRLAHAHRDRTLGSARSQFFQVGLQPA